MPNTFEDQTLCSFEDWIQIGWMFTHRFHDLLLVAVFQIMAKPHTNGNIISDCCFHTHKYVFSNAKNGLKDPSGGKYFTTQFF